MANAKIETVSKTVETTVDEKVYTLTLNEEEVKTLQSLLNSIYGSARSTYNRDTYAIWNALFDTAVPSVPNRSRFTISENRITARSL